MPDKPPKAPGRRGRPSARPSWVTPAIWEAARKRVARAGRSGDVEAQIEIAGRLIESLRSQPDVVVARRAEAKAKELANRKAWKGAVRTVARQVEEVAIPRDRVSEIMRRMGLEGRMPRMSWDPDRGVLRVHTVIRHQDISSAQEVAGLT